MFIGLSRLPHLMRHGMLAVAMVASTLVAPMAGHVVAADSMLHHAAPCIPAGHGPSAIPAIRFGRMGGNIRPFSVAIYADGTITYKGIAPVVPSYTIQMMAVLGLERLATAEGFATWPTTIKATHMFPDAATLFITLRAGCSSATRTVNLQGGASQPSFSELFATLEAATALAG
jgi:hypothetical protein